jgi:hypothetical protein
VDEEDDPDFQALSSKQRRSIDDAYDKAAGGSKKRKMAGGDAGGGFVTDDAEAGGFLPDDNDMGGGGFVDDMMMGGGFMTENAEEPIAQPTSHLYDVDGITLSALPEVMNSLELVWDEDVQAAFEGVCAQTTTNGEVYATRRDFRAVCAALMEPEQEDVDARMSEDDDEDEDVYAEGNAEDAEMADSDASSPLSEADGEFGTPNAKGKGKAKAGGRGKKAKSSNQDLRMDPAAAQVKLSIEQKEWITQMWNTMFENTQPSIIAQHGPRVLGKEQVRRWAEMLDQNWSDAEVSKTMKLVTMMRAVADCRSPL